MIPTWLQAIILGLVQGLTEFVPVSSSGHLVLVPYLLGWERPGLPFDVALHAGTALAVVVYFRPELVGIARSVLREGKDPATRFYRRLLGLLVLASVPVAVVGLALKQTFEQIFETPSVVAAFLLVTAGVILAGERLRRRRLTAAAGTAPSPSSSSPEHASSAQASPTVQSSPETHASEPQPEQAHEPSRTHTESEHVTAEHAAAGHTPRAQAHNRDGSRPIADVGVDREDPTGITLDRMRPPLALGIGLAQACALFPGLSRSAMTIVAGMVGGLTRVAATRFAFLLSLPALVGASLVSLPGLGESGPYSGLDIAVGVVAATVASYLAIAFLIRLVARTSLSVFAGYAALAGVLGLVVSVLGPPGGA